MPAPVEPDPPLPDLTLAQANAALTATLDRLEGLDRGGTAANDERRRLWRRLTQLRREVVRLLAAQE